MSDVSVVDLNIILCHLVLIFVFFFKQKTAYDMRISDWSSDVCSSDLSGRPEQDSGGAGEEDTRDGRDDRIFTDRPPFPRGPIPSLCRQRRYLAPHAAVPALMSACRSSAQHENPPYPKRDSAILLQAGRPCRGHIG